MSTRLQKLLSLLGSGSPLSRDQAARRLVDIAEEHPDERLTLLAKLEPFILAPSWDTRIAAGQAFAGIAELMQPISIIDCGIDRISIINSGIDRKVDIDQQTEWWVTFDLPQRLKEGVLLSGKELSAEAPADVGASRANLEKSLNLNPALGVSSKDLVDDCDLCDSGETQEKKPKLEVPVADEVKKEVISSHDEKHANEVSMLNILTVYLAKALDSKWEIRHGASVVLKSIAGLIDVSKSRDFLADLLATVTRILYMDRFSDYIESHISVPVRSNAAEAFAAASMLLFGDDFEPVWNILNQFLANSVPWECRLSGLLCLKQLAATRPIPKSHMEVLFAVFDSQNDDLVNVAAQVCIRAKDSWRQDESSVQRLFQATRRALQATQKDDFMVVPFLYLYHFLATEGLVSVRESLDDLAYLLPLLDSPLSAIRLQSLDLLLIKSRNAALIRGFCAESLLLLMRIFFQRILIEPKPDIQDLCVNVWSNFVENSDQTTLLSAVCPWFGCWLSFLMVSPHEPVLDTTMVYSVQTDSPPKMLIGGDEVMALNATDRHEVVLKAQLRAATCLARLVPVICEEPPNMEPDVPSPVDGFLGVIRVHLTSKSYHQHRGCLMLLAALAKICPKDHELNQQISENIRDILLQLLLTGCANPAGSFNFDEMGLKLSELNSACKKVVEAWTEVCVNVPEPPTNPVFSIRQALTLVNVAQKMPFRPPVLPYLKELLDECLYVLVSMKMWLVIAALEFGFDGELTKSDVIKPLFDALKLTRKSMRSIACDHLIDFLESRRSEPFVGKFMNNVLIYLSDNRKITPAKVSDFSDAPETMLCLNPVEHADAVVSLVVDNFVYREGIRVFLAKLMARTTDLKSEWPDLYSFLMLPPKVDLESRRILQQLQMIETLSADLSRDLCGVVLAQDPLFELLGAKLPAVRHMACRAIAALVCKDVPNGMNVVLTRFFEFLGCPLPDASLKCGYVELIYTLVDKLDHGVVGYSSLVALDTLRFMSDSISTVRDAAAVTFANIMAILPLEMEATAPPGLSPELANRRLVKMDFIRSLANPSDRSAVPDFPCKISVELRPYQMEGIQWLWFLNQYHLHGILADDMGLGKTLMALWVVLLSRSRAQISSASLVVAPASVVGHWAAEFYKLFPNSGLKSLYIANAAQAKRANVKDFADVSIVFASYDDVRKNIEVFAEFEWHYGILDEGHVIKNVKSDLFKAIIRLKAEHRLILSGTPIQNSVTDLWAAFQFLMPGYLGSQKAFNARYTKPIEKSKSPKVTQAEYNAGQKALTHLHKRVLPLVLRRLKTAVLKDLPPKVIQDIFCDMSDVQQGMYDEYLAKAEKKKSKGVKVNPFHMVRYLRQLCDHPTLVDKECTKSIADSGKFSALKDLLQECGIGTAEESVLAPHRALIFCQFKSVIDLLIDLMDSGEFGTISHLHLDGSVPPSMRQALVTRFNTDPSVDVLLLTTQVGGLGLTLTGADVVIFLDQDWNPSKDLQAMDRAHRIGQLRTVFVYRLITRGTIEQRIRQLQVSKTHISDTVVDSANQRLVSMETEQLLDLLDLRDAGAESRLEDLWSYADDRDV